MLVWLLAFGLNFEASFKDLLYAYDVLGDFWAIIHVGNVDYL